jgi:hypothetical protein
MNTLIIIAALGFCIGIYNQNEMLKEMRSQTRWLTILANKDASQPEPD